MKSESALAKVGKVCDTENKEFATMKSFLSLDVWIRCALGVAVIMGVVAIALLLGLTIN